MKQTPGELLRATRKRHRLTQRELAARSGTTQSAISRIEHDRVSPSVETLDELLRVMGEQLEVSAKDYDFGHDRSLLRSSLQRTAAERLRHAIEFGSFVRSFRGAATKNVDQE